MGRRRSSIQLEQEKKSRLQLEECFSDFGWHLVSPSPDLGEDFIVEIYNDGQNSGITFYIQEKSVTNLEKRKGKDNHLIYTLKVKDLTHWETFSLPVVIVVWDVISREGRWCTVKELISHLNQDNPKWRKNRKGVQVYVPWENKTNDEGLRRLKSEIGKHVYPLISLGKDLSLTMKLAFPKTLEGLRLQKAFDLHIKEGEPVTLKGDVIQELRLSDWWEAWFGEVDYKNAEIHLSEVTHNGIVPISLKIIPIKGNTVSLSNFEFKPIRVGTELVKFSNEHTASPILITISIRKEGNSSKGNLSYTIRHVGGEPHEILEYLDFAKAMAVGGKLQIEFQNAKQSMSINFSSKDHDVTNSQFYDLVEKLCVVSDKMRCFFRIPDEGISRKDAEAIRELFDIVTNGVVNYTDMIMTWELKRDGLLMVLDLHKQGNPIHLKLEAPDSYVELFGKQIQTGPMTRETKGFVEMNADDLKARIDSLPPEASLEVKLVNVNGTETLSDWQPNKSSL